MREARLRRSLGAHVTAAVACAIAPLLACLGGNSPKASATAAQPQRESSSASLTRARQPAPQVALAAPAAPVPGPPVSRSAVAVAKTDPSWAACHKTARATTSDVSGGVVDLAKACEQVTKMSPIGAPMVGHQADQDGPQALPLGAKANRCYRVYTRADGSIRGFDVAIKDSAGVVVGEDSTDDSSAVVPESGAVCFTKDDEASVVVSVGMGGGAYAVQVWGD